MHSFPLIHLSTLQDTNNNMYNIQISIGNFYIAVRIIIIGNFKILFADYTSHLREDGITVTVCDISRLLICFVLYIAQILMLSASCSISLLI